MANISCSCRSGYRHRRLSHPAGRGVDQHPVTGLDPGQVIEAIPGGGVRGGHRSGLAVGQARRKLRGQLGVTDDKRAPTAVGGQAPDMVTDLVIGDIRPDCRHHASEIGTQLRQPALEAGVFAKRDQDVGEVDAGCGDRNLDLSRPGRNPVERNEFHRLQVTRRADLQPHVVAFVIHDGGLPLVVAQWTGEQARRVPRAMPPGGFVFLRPA